MLIVLRMISFLIFRMYSYNELFIELALALALAFNIYIDLSIDIKIIDIKMYRYINLLSFLIQNIVEEFIE